MATAPGLQAQARLLSDYFRLVAPVPARVVEDRFYDLSDGDTQDEGDAMEVLERQRQGVKRPMEESGLLPMEESGLLPVPARETSSLQEAKDQLAKLRHQKLVAISAVFDRRAGESEPLPVMAPNEISDRFDYELQRALEQVRRHTGTLEGGDPTPCLPPAGAAAAGGAVAAGHHGGEAIAGDRDAEDGAGEARDGGRKAARVESGGGIQGAGDSGASQSVASSSGAAAPERTKWEHGGHGAAAEVSEVKGPAQRRELECPGCGRSPVAPEALTGACECGAAVCVECSEGGIVINNCLVCFERCEASLAEEMQGEGVTVMPPGPLEFAGTLTADLQDKPAAGRRAAPY